MRKPYQSPQLTDVMQLRESIRRELLAVLLMNVHTTDPWLYHKGIQTLFNTETACMEQNCRRMLAGGPSLLRFRADLLSLTRDLLSASAAVLREKGISLSFSVTGVPVFAAILPRPLQFAIISLLRAALKTETGALVAAVTVTRSQFLLTVTADRIPDHSEDLSLCAKIAALHGGRLLRSDRTVGLHFHPKTEPSADPRWHSSGIDGLVKDRLSCVRLGLYLVSEENRSSGRSS